MRYRSLLLLCACLALLAGIAVADAPRARFSDALSYTGPGNFRLTLSVMQAGGGTGVWNSATFLGVAAGSHAAAETDKLGKQFGADVVKQVFEVFDFVMSDSARLMGQKHMAMPASPDPSPKDGKALSAALYKAGIDADGRYDVEYMLDRLDSHPIHVIVMDDIDAKYGKKADALYHVVLNQLVLDLKNLYHL